MMRSFVLTLAWTFSSALAAVASAETIRVPDCVLVLSDEARVPAQERGVLVKLAVKDGDQVAQGDLLAQIDDLIPMAQYNVAKYKLKVADREALDDVDVQFSIAAHRFATAKLDRSLKANAKTINTVSEEVVDEQRLEKEKFRLAIDKARKDMDVAGLQKQVSEAELAAATANLERRRILSPIDGVVVDLKPHEGEWVQEGDTILHLMRIDQMHVEGFVSAKDHNPWELQDCPVTVIVTLARGQQESFPGKILFVKPVIEQSGDFSVRAVVQNRKQNGIWMLSPGMKAEMTIQLK